MRVYLFFKSITFLVYNVSNGLIIFFAQPPPFTTPNQPFFNRPFSACNIPCLFYPLLFKTLANKRKMYSVLWKISSVAWKIYSEP
jgi:hypothetical protein